MGKTAHFLLILLIGASCSADTLPSYRDRLSSLPYRFEQNRGQAPAENPFVAHSSNYQLLANPAGPVLRYQGKDHKQQFLKTIIRGGNRHARITAEDPQPTRTNYVVGSDPAKWLTDIPNYGRIRYTEVYPGIDLIFHGRDGNFEFDFEVKPGGDPRRISLSWKGAGNVRLNDSGDLLIATPSGNVRWAKPVIYQSRDGKRAEIAGGFRLQNNVASFLISGYDPRETLTIDPTVALTSFFGGSGNDAAAGVAVDGSGNILIAGMTTSADLPTKSTSAQPGFGGYTPDTITGDAFVAQLNPSGTTLNWVTYLGGNQDDMAYGIAVDSSGNAYVTGMTNSTNFPLKNAAFGKYAGAGGNTLNPLGDAFIVKLNSSGQLVYSSYFGGGKDESGMAIAVDSSGNAFITGVTLSPDLLVNGHSAQKQFNGSGGNSEYCSGCGPVFLGGDAFVAKFGPTGAFLWTTYLGGSKDDTGLAIAVDKTGNIYVGGSTLSSDFPTSTGALQTKFGGTASSVNQPNIKLGDGFITKLDPTGATILYSTFLGGSGDDGVFGIAVDGNGNAFLTGATSSSDFPVTKGVFQSKFAGPAAAPQSLYTPTFIYGDAFVTSLNPNGTALLYSTFLGGSADDGGNAIAVDSNGNAYVVGHTKSADFPVTPGAAQSTFGGAGGESFAVGDMFFVTLNSTGTTQTYGTYLGGAANEAAAGIFLDGSGNALVAGYTLSGNLPVSSGVYQTKFGGKSSFGVPAGDALIVKFSGLNTPAGPTILPGGIVPVYSTSTTIQPGSWFSIFGNNLTTQSATWNGDYPTKLGLTTVTVNGKSAYLWFVGNGQINAQAPDDSTTGSVPVVVTNPLGSTTGTVTLASASPSWLVLSDGKHVAGYIATPNGSGSQGGGTYDLLGPASLGAGFRPAKPGESVAIYAVGLGPTNPPVPAGQTYNCPPAGCAPMVTLPTLTVGSTQVPVVFGGIVSGGLYQINFTAPPGVSGDQTVSLKLGSGQQTQSGILVPFQ